MNNQNGKLPNEETPKEPVNPENNEGEDGGQPSPKKPDVEPDYKLKFSESARENQALAGKLKAEEERLGKIINPEPVSEEEARQSYPDWDVMTETERKIAIDNISLRKTVQSALAITSNIAEKFSFSEDFYKVVNAKNSDGSLKYPGLREKQELFREYCEMPTHKGTPLDVLARSFLFEIDETPQPKKDVTPPAKPEMNRGTPAAQNVTPPTISDEEAETIRKTDPRRYNQLIKEGKIK